MHLSLPSIIAGDHENWIETVITDIDSRVDVLPRSLLHEFSKLQSERRWLEADALTVNVYGSQRLKKSVMTEHDPWVVDAPYTMDGLELK
jgi:hypothetical protein